MINPEASHFKTWRLVPSEPASGSANMALDAVLLQGAGRSGFPPTLRFMQWEPPALSLGRFQSLDHVDMEACRREGIDVVRRPTGGGAVLHKDEFTYTVVLPVDMDKPNSVLDAYEMICRAIIIAFARLGLDVRLMRREGKVRAATDGSCFARPGTSDLVHGRAKVCGSAQARKGGGLLQHGSVLVRDNASLLYRLLRLDAEARAGAEKKFHTGCLCLEDVGLAPDREQLEEAFSMGFAEAFQVDFAEMPPTPEEAVHVLGRLRESALLDNATASSITGTSTSRRHGFVLE